MQQENAVKVNSNGITSILAQFRNLTPEKPIKNAVVYYCESHNNNDPEEKEKHQAAIDLTYKIFDMYTCEKYEVRTGYLHRYNYLPRPINECSETEMEESIIKSRKLQNDWVERITPKLPEFRIRDWHECISEEKNVYFEGCKELVLEKIKDDRDFENAFLETITNNASKSNHIDNGYLYILEELSWILSLPLLHINKPVFLIHVGGDNSALRALFHHFPNLKKSTKWLSPRFETECFKNEFDFLLDYRNRIHTGYSYALQNPKSAVRIKQFKKEEIPTREELLLMLEHERQEKDLLSYIIRKMPGHVFWLDRDNVYLGCNEEQAKHLGLNSPLEIVGKTNRMLHSEEDSDIVEKNNINVMEAGVPYKGEEISINGISYLSKKTPLFDSNGKVIGLLGISIDITDRKRVEELEIQNKIQAKINELSEQVSHDIQTPLSIFSMVLDNCKNIPEEDHIKLRNALTSIRSITSHLLFKHDDKGITEKIAHAIERYILVPYSLEDIINSKQCEYSNSNVSFNLIEGSRDAFVFIRGDFSDYFRMMSNLVNNAVEAMDGDAGTVEIGFELKDQDVEIYVKDSGKGMPKEVVDKILNDIPIGTTKKTGHGIGLQQIKKTIKQMNGKMLINSIEDEGTKITLVFQRSESPSWFVESILLPRKSLVIVLDDDKTIHDYWKNRFEPYKDDITVKYFTHGDDAVDFINFSKEKHRIFLLADYELRNQSINGVEVIEKCGLQDQSVLVTCCYTTKINGFLKKAERIKFLSKGLLDKISISVKDRKSSEIPFHG